MINYRNIRKRNGQTDRPNIVICPFDLRTIYSLFSPDKRSFNSVMALCNMLHLSHITWWLCWHLFCKWLLLISLRAYLMQWSGQGSSICAWNLKSVLRYTLLAWSCLSTLFSFSMLSMVWDWMSTRSLERDSYAAAPSAAILSSPLRLVLFDAGQDLSIL